MWVIGSRIAPAEELAARDTLLTPDLIASADEGRDAGRQG
jgi:hypothetical protein